MSLKFTRHYYWYAGRGRVGEAEAPPAPVAELQAVELPWYRLAIERLREWLLGVKEKAGEIYGRISRTI